MTPQFVGRPAADAQLRVMVKLPLRNAAELEQLTGLQSDPASPVYHHFLTPAQFRARYGPLPATVRGVQAALTARGLHIAKTESQLVLATAPASVVEGAFGVRLGVVRGPAGDVEAAADRRPAVLPELASRGAAVVGLEYHRTPRPQLRRLGPTAADRTSTHLDYWFDDLKQAYAYPTYRAFDGTGVTIATVGLSDFSDSDAALYFGHERLGGMGALAPAPWLEHLQLGGAVFNPQTDISNEANLDVQMAGGSAPGATIVGVDVPSIGEGFLYGFAEIDEQDQFDIVSTSFTSCELFYTAAYNDGIDETDILRSYHELFLQGNAQGITFIFASGDGAALNCEPAGYFNPFVQRTVWHDVPSTLIWSDDPNATSVGGTNLVTVHESGSLGSRYVTEQAVHDTVQGRTDPYDTGNFIADPLWGSGGGPSAVFKKPWYQRLVDTGSPMRTDPDIAMHMGGCPQAFDAAGHELKVTCLGSDSTDVGYVGGQRYGFIGTSLAAPEFAGLLAALEQRAGQRFGNVNGYIYRLARHDLASSGVPVFHQGMPASNGVVTIAAGQRGYNQIVGVGTPIAKNFIGAPDLPAAGDPQTPSNP